MGKSILALMIGLLPAWGAVAQQSTPHPKKAATVRPPHQAKAKACAEYGPGFAKVDGSDVCVKIGGTISVESGVNVAH